MGGARECSCVDFVRMGQEAEGHTDLVAKYFAHVNLQVGMQDLNGD